MLLRVARIEDSRLLYEWANDPEVRRMAFSSGPIAWQAHIRWFERKIKDPNTCIYIAIEDNEPVGQIRFDIINCFEANVDIHTKPGMRGKGIGSRIIALGVSRVFSNFGVNAIHAIIKQENSKSREAFQKAGFKEIQQKQTNGEACFYMIKNAHNS